MFNLYPITSCDKGLKGKTGLLPKTLISLLDSSLTPSGVSSDGILGITSKNCFIFKLTELLFSCNEIISNFNLATCSISNFVSSPLAFLIPIIFDELFLSFCNICSCNNKAT